LEEVYRRNGRFAATIEPKLIELPQNRVDVVFEIDEGPRTGIGRIVFVGNKRFSDAALRGVIQTAESRWYRFLSSDDSYDPDRVTYDREQLRRHYLKNGYADFRVLSALAELSPDKDAFFLTFTLEEGDRYKFGDVSISSSIPNLDPAQLNQHLTVDPGDWYDADKVESIVTKLTEELGNLGYAFVEIEPVAKRDRESKILGVNFEIRESPKVYLERIEVSGNIRTLDKVVRREFRLLEGDAFNAAKLRRSQQRIRNLAFFRKVEVVNVPGSAPDQTVIQVTLEEQSTGELSVGGGFSTADGVVGTVSVRERNLLGSGYDANVAVTYGSSRQQYDIGITDPYFLDLPLAAGIGLYRTERIQTNDTGYDYRTTGVRPRIGYQLSERLRQTVFYQFQVEDIFNVESTASRFIREQSGRRSTSMIGQDLFFDALDSRIDPTEGYFLGSGTDVAGLGGDSQYLRVRGRAGVYYPLAPEYVLSMRIEAGHILGLGQKVRIGDRYFPGSDNFRGFRFGGAGPRDIASNDALGGNTYYVITPEVSIPLGLPKELGISGRVFSDIGSSFGLDNVSGPDIRDTASIRAAAGVGVTWKSPFGPIRIDFSRPYVKEKFDRSELIRFSFGTRFN
jgi:outer membrane protein insertion porin family